MRNREQLLDSLWVLVRGHRLLAWYSGAAYVPAAASLETVLEHCGQVVAQARNPLGRAGVLD
jgi:hypothetical protein